MLTEQDKSDLIGLVSGFGSAESDARARELTAQSEEAARFLDQVRLLASSIEPPAQPERATLAPAEIERISRGAYDRWRGRRVRRIFAPLTIAAAIAFLAFGVQRALRTVVPNDKPPELQATMFSLNRYAGGDSALHTFPVEPGQLFQTDATKLAVVRMDGQRVILDRLSTAIFSSSSVDLKIGQAALESAGSIAFRAGPVQGDIHSGKMLLSRSEDKIRIAVYQGRVVAKTTGESSTLTDGDGAAWDADGRLLHKGRSFEPWPLWASEAENIDSAPLPRIEYRQR